MFARVTGNIFKRTSNVCKSNWNCLQALPEMFAREPKMFARVTEMFTRLTEMFARVTGNVRHNDPKNKNIFHIFKIANECYQCEKLISRYCSCQEHNHSENKPTSSQKNMFTS